MVVDPAELRRQLRPEGEDHPDEQRRHGALCVRPSPEDAQQVDGQRGAGHQAVHLEQHRHHRPRLCIPGHAGKGEPPGHQHEDAAEEDGAPLEGLLAHDALHHVVGEDRGRGVEQRHEGGDRRRREPGHHQAQQARADEVGQQLAKHGVGLRLRQVGVDEAATQAGRQHEHGGDILEQRAQERAAAAVVQRAAGQHHLHAGLVDAPEPQADHKHAAEHRLPRDGAALAEGVEQLGLGGADLLGQAGPAAHGLVGHRGMGDHHAAHKDHNAHDHVRVGHAAQPTPHLEQHAHRDDDGHVGPHVAGQRGRAGLWAADLPRPRHLGEGLGQQAGAGRHREEDGQDGHDAIDEVGAVAEALAQELRHGVDPAGAVERQENEHEHHEIEGAHHLVLAEEDAVAEADAGEADHIAGAHVDGDEGEADEGPRERVAGHEKLLFRGPPAARPRRHAKEQYEEQHHHGIVNGGHGRPFPARG